MWANEKEPAESWGVGAMFEVNRSREFTKEELRLVLLKSMAYSLSHIEELEVKIELGDPVAIHLDKCSKDFIKQQSVENMQALILAVAGFKAAASN